MKKTALTILGSALIAASLVQVASAGERHRAHRADRAPVTNNQPFRNSNAFFAPSYDRQPQADTSQTYRGASASPAR